MGSERTVMNASAIRKTKDKAARRLSVIHVIGGLAMEDGGPSRSVPNQCYCTEAVGFEVGIAFVRGHSALSPEADALAERGVQPYPVHRLGSARALWRAIQRYDIVHVNGIWSYLPNLGCYFAHMQKKPLVVTPHGMLEPWSLSQKSLKKKIGLWLYQRRALRMASVLQATAPMEAEHIRALGLDVPVAVIPNGVEIPDFSGKPEKLSGGRRRLLFLSRIHPKKGVLELVRAVAALREHLVKGKWVVTIAGPDEGQHLAEVRREAARLGVGHLLEFPGAVEGAAKWSLYRSSDLFVFPTYSENFGLVVAEALGCGVPVITTQGAPWEELKTHRCGWWQPVGQAALEKALKEALLGPSEKLKDMGQRGVRLVRRRYGWPSVGAELRDLYLEVMRGRDASSSAHGGGNVRKGIFGPE
jgi:glycosyltransferase involved in cell wall biosynthesis